MSHEHLLFRRFLSVCSLLILLALPALASTPEASGVASPAPVELVSAAAADDGDHPAPPAWLVIPFVVLLLLIATGPLFFAHHWHHHYPKYAVALGTITGLYYIFVLHSATPVMHAAEEYFSFIALLASLYIASGGILIRMNKKGTPIVNAALLLFGALISNVIGTTGASMLLIRPYMRLNEGRIRPYHIVFFIFTVSNVGGALTPIGDPPLFLGFLRGVPFFWTLVHVWYIWLPTILLIVLVFYFVDRRNQQTSSRELEPGAPSFQITGKKNFAWLALVVICVFIDPNVLAFVPELHFGSVHLPFGIREIIMFAICFLSYRLASQEALRGNDFNFEPIKEVGYLFIGIFLTMQPALELIGGYARENADALGVSTFYWGTGILSGILDNAPTYVSFLSAAMGKFGLSVNELSDVAAFAAGSSDPSTIIYLEAISVAAVFFGALTYIGNGPNFMVKAIAESAGVECPSFFGYMVRYALTILIPIYFVVWVIWFSGWVF
ncbi:MAG: sodium:proton antiporter [Bacteroidota bacterium]